MHESSHYQHQPTMNFAESQKKIGFVHAFRTSAGPDYAIFLHLLYLMILSPVPGVLMPLARLDAVSQWSLP